MDNKTLVVEFTEGETSVEEFQAALGKAVEGGFVALRIISNVSETRVKASYVQVIFMRGRA